MDAAQARTLRIARPLCGIETCQTLLGVDEDRVVALVEGGALPFAFDVRSRHAARRMMRVLSRCVEDYQLGRPPLKVTLDEAIQMILPGYPAISAPVLRKLMNASGTHITDLVREKSLELAPGSPVGQPGPSGSAKILRASVVEFLKRRRVT